ncbi:MAG: hypothetical protein M3Q32_12135 [Pseudomonadota bacterium]|nr:hypothetical protein [Pseudomonadota bacterium]
MPADVIAFFCVVIQRIGMRIGGRTRQELATGDPIQIFRERRLAIQLAERWRQPIEFEAADAAAFFMSGNVIAMNRRFEPRQFGQQALQQRRRHKIGHDKKVALRSKRLREFQDIDIGEHGAFIRFKERNESEACGR